MTEKIISINSMNKGDLKNLTKTQLINFILKQNNEIKVSQQQNAKPIPKPRTTKPVPLPRKSVKQMVQDYEDNIILPPLEFRDDYTNQSHYQEPKSQSHYQEPKSQSHCQEQG